jgi:hypothetical protein
MSEKIIAASPTASRPLCVDSPVRVISSCWRSPTRSLSERPVRGVSVLGRRRIASASCPTTENGSALPPKADIVFDCANSCYGPLATVMQCSKVRRYSITSPAMARSLSGICRQSCRRCLLGDRSLHDMRHKAVQLSRLRYREQVGVRNASGTRRTSDDAVCCSRASASSRVRALTCACRSARVELAGRAAVGALLRFGLVGLRCCVFEVFRFTVPRRLT